MVRRDIKASGTYKGKAFVVNLRVMEYGCMSKISNILVFKTFIVEFGF